MGCCCDDCGASGRWDNLAAPFIVVCQEKTTKSTKVFPLFLFPLFFFFADERYFVGAHLAELLGRETFNLYGSLKRRNIALWRGDEALLHFLIARNVVLAGTSSLTLVRVDDVEAFVTKAIEDIEVSKGSSEFGFFLTLSATQVKAKEGRQSEGSQQTAKFGKFP